MGNTDPSQRQLLGLATIPALPGQYTLGSSTISANSTRSFAVTTTPNSSILNLWNFLFSISIDPPTINDVLATDSSGNLLYVLPIGTALTAGQLLVTIDPWTDWATSSDSTNLRKNIIRIHNQDSSSHTYYLMFKAYTFSNGAVATLGSGGGGI